MSSLSSSTRFCQQHDAAKLVNMCVRCQSVPRLPQVRTQALHCSDHAAHQPLLALWVAGQHEPPTKRNGQSVMRTRDCCALNQLEPTTRNSGSASHA
eukprot:CAMPEP_0196662756 /NCGR_PEP_ID=MMETSP1086-20130531/50180_1 /TAXON_ID=77921 /ORGANISM="Cyanoptyche  gloeocystis , Strain SAG4.97" /LENGTH=96 /DNA_ID=CAMNT_0041998311 /DNA_START=85 /DNA_END=375 /DNA_ORIENTATION=-